MRTDKWGNIVDEDEAHYEEIWVVIVNDSEYELNKKQAEVLNDAISKGRGIVQFKGFVISIPFIKEFYIIKRFLKPEYQIQAPLSEEEQRHQDYLKMTPKEREEAEKERLVRWEIQKKKVKELNKKIKEKSAVIPKKMTQKRFEELRKAAQEQANKLEISS